MWEFFGASLELFLTGFEGNLWDATPVAAGQMMFLVLSCLAVIAGSRTLTERETVKDSPCTVLYKLHVESFTRIGDSSIAIGHRTQLLLTTNLGRTWALRGVLPEENIIKQIFWIDSRHVVLNASYTGHGEIYYSRDGGRSFKRSLKNTAASEAIVWDTAAGTLYAADNTNRFIVSRDQGRTWRKWGAQIPFQQRPRVSHFCSLTAFVERGRKVFYASTSYPGQILRSRDTGRHWMRIFSDSVIFRNREIPMIGKLHDGRLFAVSAEGSVDAPGYALIGPPSGRNWKVIPTPEGMWYFGELPSRPGFLVAGGFSLGRNVGDAALFLSSNYGRTWRGKPVLGAALVWQIECVTPDTDDDSSTWLLATDKGLLQLNINSIN